MTGRAQRTRDSHMLSRRELLALATALALPIDAVASAASTLRAIQKRSGGRLGVHILDSQSGRRIGFEDGARFAMASTFKVPLVAGLLWQVDHGAFPLEHTLPVSKGQLLPNSPVLQPRIDAGATEMTVRELCAAAITYSDNAAANVLLAGMGGPQSLTSFARSLGDQETRFDRTEPDLNGNTPGDPRDTTTPRAMAELMLKIFTQDALSLTSRALLIDWMTASRIGVDRVRAGLPHDWQAADKPGTGENGAFNDLVITWPPERRPILIAVYMSGSKLDAKQLAAAHAEIGQLAGREKWP
jgi:beta-lactamase class A